MIRYWVVYGVGLFSGVSIMWLNLRLDIHRIKKNLRTSKENLDKSEDFLNIISEQMAEAEKILERVCKLERV